jgi:hypothetical protein
MIKTYLGSVGLNVICTRLPLTNFLSGIRALVWDDYICSMLFRKTPVSWPDL